VGLDRVGWEFDPLEGLNIPEENRAEALDIAKNYVKEQILQYVADGDSPVEGERFPKLSKEYAEEEKIGDSSPNLEKTGRMLDALEVFERDGLIVVEIAGTEAPKAEGHNQHDPSLDHPLPRRRFIPTEDQSLKTPIMAGLREALSPLEALEEDADEEQIQDRREVAITEEVAASLFGFDILTDILRRSRRTGS
jgi:hypothetical protein